jgi:hypothetical protein
MFRSKLILTWILRGAPVASLLAAAPVAAAQEEKPVDLAALMKEVESGDRDRMLAAMQQVEKSKEPALAPAVEAVLARGAPADVLVAAMKAAGKIKTESTSTVIAPYVRHRTPEVRQAAVSALLKTGGPEAKKALTAALRSSDAVVRGTAAAGLGELGVHESVGDLFLAFERGVSEAAASIGVLCLPDECERFAALMGKKPFDVMIAGFDQILFRPPKDVPDDQKIRLIGRMRELGTAEVGKYLADVAERWPKDWSSKVKQALDSAAKASGGSR